MIYAQLTKVAMPKMSNIDPNDDEDDVREKIHQACLTTTIYKEDVRLIITESAKNTPSKSTMASGGGAGIKKPTPSKRPMGGGIGGGQFGKPKMGGGFGGPRKPIGGGIKPKGIGASGPAKSTIGAGVASADGIGAKQLIELKIENEEAMVGPKDEEDDDNVAVSFLP